MSSTDIFGSPVSRISQLLMIISQAADSRLEPQALSGFDSIMVELMISPTYDSY
ncbi:hypothetical protein H6G70_25545 [Arthrospira platensis FACHB-439]|uniref:hypothetical protein n=1 Tax=Limnospira platensis TaxID=118562 RepID=UPI0016883B4F|nr:hypothetical protein [Arthrospira platensis FACHB-439]